LLRRSIGWCPEQPRRSVVLLTLVLVGGWRILDDASSIQQSFRNTLVSRGRESWSEAGAGPEGGRWTRDDVGWGGGGAQAPAASARQAIGVARPPPPRASGPPRTGTSEKSPDLRLRATGPEVRDRHGQSPASARSRLARHTAGAKPAWSSPHHVNPSADAGLQPGRARDGGDLPPDPSAARPRAREVIHPGGSAAVLRRSRNRWGRGGGGGRPGPAQRQVSISLDATRMGRGLGRCLRPSRFCGVQQAVQGRAGGNGPRRKLTRARQEPPRSRWWAPARFGRRRPEKKFVVGGQAPTRGGAGGSGGDRGARGGRPRTGVGPLAEGGGGSSGSRDTTAPTNGGIARFERGEGTAVNAGRWFSATPGANAINIRGGREGPSSPGSP